MKTSLLFGLLFIFGAPSGFSQSNAAETAATVQSMADGNSMFRSFDNRNKQTKGSYMIFEEYLPGGITMNDGQEFEFNRMNYDGYFDAIVVIRKKQEQVVTTMMVKSFYIVEYKDTLYFDRMLRSDNRMGYYQRLTDGAQVKLYKKLFTTYTPPNYSGAYSPGKQYAEIKPESAYYIQQDKFRPKEFKNRKALQELFPEEAEKISLFVKQHKTDFKKDDDVRSLVEYINDLRVSAEPASN